MSKSSVEQLTIELEKLTSTEKQEIAKRLMKKMDNDEIQELLKQLKEDTDLLEMLKMVEPVFDDWNNEEDEIYDHL